jgi:hypothetical protein
VVGDGSLADFFVFFVDVVCDECSSTEPARTTIGPPTIPAFCFGVTILSIDSARWRAVGSFGFAVGPAGVGGWNMALMFAAAAPEDAGEEEDEEKEEDEEEEEVEDWLRVEGAVGVGPGAARARRAADAAGPLASGFVACAIAARLAIRCS